MLRNVSILFLSIGLLASEPKIIERSAWFFDDSNTTRSGEPTNLKYFQYYDLMPDEVNLEIFKEKNLSAFAGKKIFVGYGVVDPTGSDCRVFPPSQTGMENDVTVCLPWWRIERDYQLSASTALDMEQFFCTMPKPRPPKLVNVCQKWEDVRNYQYPGGKVTCTSYYNRLLSSECWDNPKQAACFVNNCSEYVKKNCTHVASVMGERTQLTTVKYGTPSTGDSGIGPTAVDTKIDVLTYQYQCPAGALVPNQRCTEQKTALMFPYECKPDNPNTRLDDGEYVYCDSDKPQYDGGGNIVGFLGKCGDGRQIMCDVDRLSETKLECVNPKYSDNEKVNHSTTTQIRGYEEKSVDVLSGQPDIYSADQNCVRANTIADARNVEIFVKIRGEGYIDDDIYVLRHKSDGGHIKVYCNMQHNENAGSRKSYNGEIMQCIDNDGVYSFNQTVQIDSTDIVSIQQATENENANPTPFVLGRTHYLSTKVTIDDVLAAPAGDRATYPFYPELTYLKLWDNTLGAFSLMFPFSGAYRIQFFNKEGDLVGDETVGVDDFETISKQGHIQLKLAKKMVLANGKTTENSCLDDDLVEWGGGVFGGKGSKDGKPCIAPDDAHVQKMAIYNVLVRDLLTGSITPIPLVYPLAYPNRIYVSKLNVYEKRKYRCYQPFPFQLNQ